MFIQRIKANCFSRVCVCVHDSQRPPEMLSVARVQQKAQSQWGAPLGASGGESLLFQQMEEISTNVFFLSSPELAGAARSGECDQPLCLSALSGEICGVTQVNRGQSAVWKNHYTEPDIFG